MQLATFKITVCGLDAVPREQFKVTEIYGT